MPKAKAKPDGVVLSGLKHCAAQRYQAINAMSWTMQEAAHAGRWEQVDALAALCAKRATEVRKFVAQIVESG